MNIETGELITNEEHRKLIEDAFLNTILKSEVEDYVPVRGELTKKQKTAKQVSLSDHRSEVGKQLTEERRKRGLTKNRYRRLKRKGKLS